MFILLCQELFSFCWNKILFRFLTLLSSRKNVLYNNMSSKDCQQLFKRIFLFYKNYLQLEDCSQNFINYSSLESLLILPYAICFVKPQNKVFILCQNLLTYVKSVWWHLRQKKRSKRYPYSIQNVMIHIMHILCTIKFTKHLRHHH